MTSTTHQERIILRKKHTQVLISPSSCMKFETCHLCAVSLSRRLHLLQTFCIIYLYQMLSQQESDDTNDLTKKSFSKQILEHKYMMSCWSLIMFYKQILLYDL